MIGSHDIKENIKVTYEELLTALDEFSESELETFKKTEIINLLEQINPLIEQARQMWCRKIMRLFEKQEYKCWATRVDANGTMLEDFEIPHNFWVSDISLSYNGEIITNIGSNVGKFINLHIKLNIEILYAQKAKNMHEFMERHYYENPQVTPFSNDYKKYLKLLSVETGLGIRASLDEYKKFLNEKIKANEYFGWTKPLARGEKLSTKAKAVK